MTKEFRIKVALDDFSDAMDSLRKQYDQKLNWIIENGFEEVRTSEILECNMWMIQQENLLKNKFIATLSTIG